MFRSGTGNPQVKHETGDEVRIEATQTGSKKTGMFVVFVLLVDPVSGSRSLPPNGDCDRPVESSHQPLPDGVGYGCRSSRYI